MWRLLKSTVIDELAGVFTLHKVLRHRNHPPVRGTTLAGFPDLLSGDPGRMFVPKPEPVNLDRFVVARERHAAATVLDLQIPSQVENPFREAADIRGRWYRATEGDNQLTIVGMDGLVQFSDGWFRALARELAPRGIDVVMVEPPFSNRRTPPGYRPGQLIVQGDLDHQMSVSRQSILDMWTVVRSVQQTGRRVGLVGVSYGGWASLMTSLLADSLACLVAVAPPVHMGRLIQEGGPITRASREGLGRGELDPVFLEQVARGVSPLFWQSRISGTATVLHAARWDRFVPTHRIEQLAGLWQTDFRVHPTGHMGITTSRKIVREVAADIPALASQATAPVSSAEHTRPAAPGTTSAAPESAASPLPASPC